MTAGGTDLEALRQLAVELATAAGDVVAEHHGRAAPVGVKSSRTDLVTAADRAAESLIASRLARARPHDGIVGEEGASRAGSTGITWFIDPIDGTTNFVYGHPGYSVSVAAAAGGRPLAGAVVDPLHGEVFSAARGGGAVCNGERLAVSSTEDLGSALVATGFGYNEADRIHQGSVVAGLLGRVRDIRRMGSAALDLCSVACGRVDAYYEYRLCPWDHAAGSLIASEAGAVTRSPLLEPPGRSGAGAVGFVLAAAPGVAPALSDLLAELGAWPGGAPAGGAHDF
ncbi:MAG: inositol monophosphatase family protein [bacterium]|nr:inositol monophosphatase family protein [bacterium]